MDRCLVADCQLQLKLSPLRHFQRPCCHVHLSLALRAATSRAGVHQAPCPGHLHHETSGDWGSPCTIQVGRTDGRRAEGCTSKPGRVDGKLHHGHTSTICFGVQLKLGKTVKRPKKKKKKKLSCKYPITPWFWHSLERQELEVQLPVPH